MVQTIKVAIPEMATLFTPSVPDTFSVANLISTCAITKKKVPNNKGHLRSSLVGICTDEMDLLERMMEIVNNGNKMVQQAITIIVNRVKTGLTITKIMVRK